MSRASLMSSTASSSKASTSSRTGSASNLRPVEPSAVKIFIPNTPEDLTDPEAAVSGRQPSRRYVIAGETLHFFAVLEPPTTMASASRIQSWQQALGNLTTTVDYVAHRKAFMTEDPDVLPVMYCRSCGITPSSSSVTGETSPTHHTPFGTQKVWLTQRGTVVYGLTADLNALSPMATDVSLIVTFQGLMGGPKQQSNDWGAVVEHLLSAEVAVGAGVGQRFQEKVTCELSVASPPRLYCTTSQHGSNKHIPWKLKMGLTVT
eukprot:m.420957 g.420957  ORF g.420957 m.420957 type:complete len:262 (+) comp20192_c0_seq10:101-886(+)